MSAIALLPSSNHLLPGGRAEITIAEERYIRMIKQSLAGERHFALCMLNEGEEHNEIKKIPAIATIADIIDFNTAENGLLTVVVEGKQKVRLLAIKIEKDGLLFAEYQLYPNWSAMPVDNTTACLAEKLRLYFSSMPAIGSLYEAADYDDICWVCQRWLEILPLEVKYKQLLITQDNSKLTVRFLLKLMDNDEPFNSELL